MSIKPKKRKCVMREPGCDVLFWPGNPPTRNWCNNSACIAKKAAIIAGKQLQKKRSARHKEKVAGREKLITIAGRLKRAREKAFQVWVKMRDFAYFAENGKQPACIMCGNTSPTVWHACHFQSVGAKPELQFHPDNCHLGCGQCNFFKAQGDTDYRVNLIDKVGVKMVEYLENFNSTIRWDHGEIEEVRDYYKSRIKGLR